MTHTSSTQGSGFGLEAVWRAFSIDGCRMLHTRSGGNA